MRLGRLYTTCLLLSCSMGVAGAANATVTFTDSNFTAANYQIGFAASSGGATLTSARCTTCGDPGAAIRFVISDSDGSNLGAAILNKLFVYNPQTQGAIGSISATVDKNFTVVAPPLFSYGNTFRLLIAQGGSYYTANTPAIFGPTVTVPPGGTTATSGYTLFTLSNLVAADFSKFDVATGLIGTDHPDFAGSKITFGFGQVIAASPQSAGSSVKVTSDFDNLSIKVQGVPEPGTWAMFVGGLGLVGGAMRRRQRIAVATA